MYLNDAKVRTLIKNLEFYIWIHDVIICASIKKTHVFNMYDANDLNANWIMLVVDPGAE